jgi:RND family efflux transporter MFP subunit
MQQRAFRPEEKGESLEAQCSEPETPTPRPVAQPEKRPARARFFLQFFVVVVILATIVAFEIIPRMRANAALRAETADLAVPTVNVVHPQRGAAAQEVVLPGNIQAYIDAPIYARTSGYLRQWYADIGAHVRKGQLLAEIDTPEIDQQLRQARAELATGEADLKLAQTTAERYTNLLKSNSVSKQDTDTAVSSAAAKAATVQSAEANVKRLEDLAGFEQIYAPFDGVITARNTDIGQLIDPGAGGTAHELFHIASINKLRVFVDVPQAYWRQVRPGIGADVTFTEIPGRRFGGTVVRTADAIDPSSRTLRVEVDVNNSSGELVPGAYCEVHFKLRPDAPALILPVTALIFRSEGLRVATVDANGRARLIPVTLGRDLGNAVEVASGLNGNESVISDPPDSLVEGEAVRVASTNGQGATKEE